MNSFKTKHTTAGQKKRCLGAVAAAALAAAAYLPAASAQSIVNGGFEAGSFSGWTTSGDILASGVTCPGAGATVSEGSCSAFLGTLAATGSVLQTFSTSIGQAYLISFAVQYDGGMPSAFDAAFGNTSLYSVTNPAATTGFLMETFQATATSNSTTLAFNFRDDPGYIYLDAVSVAAVPEPATFTLFALGALGIAAKRRLHRRS